MVRVKTGQTLKILSEHPFYYVFSLASLPNGLLASGSSDSTVKIWGTNSGKTVQTLKGIDGYARCLAVRSDGRTALACGSNMQITVWFLDLKNSLANKQKKRLDDSNFQDSVWCLAFLPNEKLASGSQDGEIRI
jgi:WD40 repeat protein